MPNRWVRRIAELGYVSRWTVRDPATAGVANLVASNKLNKLQKQRKPKLPKGSHA